MPVGEFGIPKTDSRSAASLSAASLMVRGAPDQNTHAIYCQHFFFGKNAASARKITSRAEKGCVSESRNLLSVATVSEGTSSTEVHSGSSIG